MKTYEIFVTESVPSAYYNQFILTLVPLNIDGVLQEVFDKAKRDKFIPLFTNEYSAVEWWKSIRTAFVEYKKEIEDFNDQQKFVKDCKDYGGIFPNEIYVLPKYTTE
jgi:hypothetical protein